MIRPDSTPTTPTPRKADPPVGAALRDVFLNPAIATVVTLALLGVFTRLLLLIDQITGVSRPYTILYLIPVAIGAAFLGVRGGVLAAVIALILARIYLFNDAKHGVTLFTSFPTFAETIEFVSLALGTFVIAFVTGRLRTTLGLLSAANRRLSDTNTRLMDANVQLERANQQILESERQRRSFNRDVLLAVTGGKLRLVEPDEMPPDDIVDGSPRLTLALKTPEDATELRTQIHALADEVRMVPERVSDLITSVTEAATNAVKHGNGGEARVWATAEGIAVQIQDQGGGISPTHLARATLEQGYSTRISLGMGFYLMLQTADTLALCTSSTGTTVMLQVSNRPRPTDEDSLLARYSNI